MNRLLEFFRGRRRRRAGFTLLEMLVAITLLALIAASLSGSLRFGLRVWETADRVDEKSRVAAVQQLLFRWLQETEQIRMPGNDGNLLRGIFEGHAQALRFAGVQHGIGLPGGYYLNELYFDESGKDGGALMLRRRLVQPVDAGLMAAAHESVDGEARVLLEGVVKLEITFFGSENVADAPAWLESWQGRLDLPKLVRVRLEFARGDFREWPELTVPLIMAAD